MLGLNLGQLPQRVADMQAIRAQVPKMSYAELRPVFDAYQREWIHLENQRKAVLAAKGKDYVAKVRNFNQEISSVKAILSVINPRLHALGKPPTIYRPDSGTCHPPGKKHYKCAGPPAPRPPGSPKPGSSTMSQPTGQKIWCGSSYAYQLCAPGQNAGPCTKSIPAKCRCCPPERVTPGPTYKPRPTARPPATTYPDRQIITQPSSPDFDAELAQLEARIAAEEAAWKAEQEAWEAQQAQWASQQQQADMAMEQAQASELVAPVGMPVYAQPVATGPAFEPAPVAQLAPVPISPEESEAAAAAPATLLTTARVPPKKPIDKKKALIAAAVAGAVLLL